MIKHHQSIRPEISKLLRPTKLQSHARITIELIFLLNDMTAFLLNLDLIKAALRTELDRR